LGLLDAGEVDWPRLPALLGALPVEASAIKAPAEILAQDQDGRPLVITRPYGSGGSGHVLLLAVDDTWSWRRNAGDFYLHRFHSQLLRFVAQGRRDAASEARLVVHPRRVVTGEAATLSVLPSDPASERLPANVAVRLRGPDGREQVLRLNRDADGFSTTFTAPTAGAWEMALAAGFDPRAVNTEQLLVLPPSDEWRDPRVDLDGLGALAQGSGGELFTDAERLVAALPDLRKQESITVLHGLWDSAWALALVVALLAVDWAVRRRHRLP